MWIFMKNGIVGNDHGLNNHFVPPLLAKAVLRDIDAKHKIKKAPELTTRAGCFWIDFGGMVHLSEKNNTTKFLLAGGTRAVEVMAHHRSAFLDQLRRKIDDPNEHRLAGARWPWVKLHYWPGRCLVIYLAEARRLVAEMEEAEEAYRLGAEFRNKRMKKILADIPNVIVEG